MIELNHIDQVLEKIAEQLDLDDTRSASAEEKYKAIGVWLDAEQSGLAINKPRIYAQGSFALGTVVKPINSDEYDVDLVCHLSDISRDASPQAIKRRVGDRFKQHKDYAEKLEEKNRCWRINYAGDFHLDVTPAISDYGQTTSLLIPDKTLVNWEPSNPEGYAKWFRSRMAAQYMKKKAALAEAAYKSIDEIPDYAVKTPLQRVIQLLKRHRDIQFGDDENKPISMIITTLAAHSYMSQDSLCGALVAVAKSLRSCVEVRGRTYWVANPANPLENFADKWQEQTELETAFFRWTDDLVNHILSLEQCSSLVEAEKLLYSLFGEQVVSTAIKAVAPTYKSSITVRPAYQFDVPHRIALSWPLVRKYKVTITARVVEARKHVQYRVRGVMPHSLSSGGSTLRKGFGLKYYAVTDAPPPYEVRWQIVNTGEEARAKDGLRGQSFELSNRIDGKIYIKEETTLYKGTHWIEAFVIKNGLCVARSGEFVITVGD